jgi:hypothetical protein
MPQRPVTRAIVARVFVQPQRPRAHCVAWTLGRLALPGGGGSLAQRVVWVRRWIDCSPKSATECDRVSGFVGPRARVPD